MIKVLQGNIHRSRTANDLLKQFEFEMDIDIFILSEQYQDRDHHGWFSDNLGTAAIFIPDLGKYPVKSQGSEDGFVWIKSGMLTYVSCYFTPNESIHDFQKKLDNLEDTLRSFGNNLIVAGDFNAKAQEWGMPNTNSRGRRILEMTARLGLSTVNVGNTSTFRRPGCEETIPDVTFASEDLVPAILEWRVIEDYTGSDHQYVTFSVSQENRPQRVALRKLPYWNPMNMDKGKFCEVIQRGMEKAEMSCLSLEGKEAADKWVEHTMLLIRQACNASMGRKKPRHSKQPAYWWTEEIADKRRLCLRLRRRAQRARGREEAALLSEDHKSARKALRNAIKRSKAEKWWSLAEEIDKDPWGLGYKLVLKKLGALSNPITDIHSMDEIVSTLFPDHPERNEEDDDGIDLEEIPPFTSEELMLAINSLRNKKAPGPDGIPTEALKETARTCPQLLLNMYNACLKAGVFSARWKKARLVLISKGKLGGNLPSSYRPLCILDTAGKGLEKLLQPRILKAVQTAGDLSPQQHGFRRGHSTLDAVRVVIDTAERAQVGNHYSRKVTLLVTLDVKNAFNSARWIDILDALRDKFRLPKYLLRMMRDYLKDRILQYETDKGQMTKRLTSGAAQGSILGPDLWNIAYDGLLRLEMPQDSILVGYADDVAAVIVARDIDLAQLKLNQVMRRLTEWMSDHKLVLAEHKTEIVMLTRKRINTLVPMQVGQTIINTSRSTKYLGVTLDTKLTFWAHIQRVTDKAAKIVTALSRLMGNIKGPKPSKRRLLMTTVQSVLLYGAEIWAESLRIEKYRKKIAAVQRRGALRVTCAYRTVSEPAVLVIAGVAPIDLLALERQEVWCTKEELGVHNAKLLAHNHCMEQWQQKWDDETRGRWTKRLIPHLTEWIDRNHGEVDYYMTQFLTGHGYFRKFLHRIGVANSAMCLFCNENDDVLHTFFVCERWHTLRRDLEASLGEITPDNIIQVMLHSEEAWNQVAIFIEAVLRQKKGELDAQER